MTFSQQEFINLQGKKDENEYFRKRADLLINLNRRNAKPAFGFSKDWVNRITGNGKVDIKPSGYIDIAAGYQPIDRALTLKREISAETSPGLSERGVST